jgi:hypothetical protein
MFLTDVQPVDPDLIVSGWLILQVGHALMPVAYGTAGSAWKKAPAPLVGCPQGQRGYKRTTIGA